MSACLSKCCPFCRMHKTTTVPCRYHDAVLHRHATRVIVANALPSFFEHPAITSRAKVINVSEQLFESDDCASRARPITTDDGNNDGIQVGEFIPQREAQPNSVSVVPRKTHKRSTSNRSRPTASIDWEALRETAKRSRIR